MFCVEIPKVPLLMQIRYRGIWKYIRIYSHGSQFASPHDSNASEVSTVTGMGAAILVTAVSLDASKSPSSQVSSLLAPRPFVASQNYQPTATGIVVVLIVALAIVIHFEAS